jgi:hypothetical protein
MPISKKKAFVNVASIATIALIILFSILTAQAQSSANLEPSSSFAIPELNGNINFVLNGTYAQASLQNNTWVFVNLQSIDLLRPQNMSVSVTDCNVTIASYRMFNITIVGMFLNYLVYGQGNQTFHFNPLQRGGDWSVTFNGSFIGENEGWLLSPGGTLTVYKAPSGSNVTLAYFVFPDALGGNGNNSNLPFFQRHSVIIATSIAVTITMGAAVAVTIVSKRNQHNRSAKSVCDNRITIKQAYDKKKAKE